MPETASDWQAAAAADTVRIVIDLLPRFYRSVAGELAQDAGDTVVPAKSLYRLLGLVAQHPRTNLTELAGRLGMTKTNASPLVEKLVQEGLLERSSHPDDRRVHLLSLTPKGQQTFELGWSRLTQGISERLSGLSPGEGEAFTAALSVVVRTLPRLI